MKLGVIPAIALALLALPVAASGADWYVTPAGAGVACTFSMPCDLDDALDKDVTPAQPGDTIWLRGGIYPGTFHATLSGNSTAPIVIRQYPGERAIIDGRNSNGNPILTISGAWTWFWGFVIMSSDPVRLSASTDSAPPDIGRGEGILISQTPGSGVGSKFINLIVHDTREGFGFWEEAQGAEIYGCIIYNNGWDGPPGDRGHGHGIYVQNRTDPRQILDNVIFNQFGFGIHGFGTSDAFLDNIDVEGNIVFGNGAPSVAQASRNILVGGGAVAHNTSLIDNYTYGASVQLGETAPSDGAVVRGNLFANPGDTAVELNAQQATVEQNSFLGNVVGFSDSSFPNNQYVTATPTGFAVAVRPNQYEPGRAHIVVYNWDHRPAADVDLSAVLGRGDPYDIYDVQNLSGRPLASGVFSGTPVTIPLDTAGPVMQPTGVTARAVAHTPMEFAVFLVTPAPRANRWRQPISPPPVRSR
jgi:hypothetical protein